MKTPKITSKKIIILTVSGIEILLLSSFIASSITHAWAQNQQQMITNNNIISMMERGNIAMGFNQSKITHNFKSTATGGDIMITALDDRDAETIKQIRNHTLDIQRDFSEGNFTKPFFIHAEQVPGTKIMSQKKDLIKYGIFDMRNGSTLILTTSDKQLIDAIRKFMDFQATATPRTLVVVLSEYKFISALRAN